MSNTVTYNSELTASDTGSLSEGQAFCMYVNAEVRGQRSGYFLFPISLQHIISCICLFPAAGMFVVFVYFRDRRPSVTN